MKSIKRIISYALGILVLVGVLNEIGIIKVNCYIHHKLSDHMESKWSHSCTTGDANDSITEPVFPEVPIVVIYKTIRVGDITAENPTIINVSDKDLGTYWVPFFKKSNYSFSVAYRGKCEMQTGTFFCQKEHRGDIEVSGSFRIVGLCSTMHATELIVPGILNSIYDDVQKNIK